MTQHKIDQKKKKEHFYLCLFMRTASIEVRKFNSLRAVPLVVLNKQRRRGDKDGCYKEIIIIRRRESENDPTKVECYQLNESKGVVNTCSPAPTIASRSELNNISTILKAPIAREK